MSHRALYRQYRPAAFSEMIGQEHITTILKNQVKSGTTAHAYLFAGTRGTGKTSAARILARAVNCEEPMDGEPCGCCRSCKISAGECADIIELDAASNTGVDDMRDIIEKARFMPLELKHKVYIIDEAHALSANAFNALLKTLEEPPPHVKFIFATTEPHKILPTILSRCQRFDLRPIPSEIIAEHLLHIASAEGVSLSREAAFAVAKVADGGMRDAQSMLDQLVSFCGDHIEEQQVLHIFGITSRETVAHALALILNKELPSLLHLLHEQAEAGRDMGQFLSEIISAVREILVSKVDPEASFDSLPESSKEELSELVKRTQTDKILRLVEVLAETEDKMRWSTNKRLHLEMGLIKAVHALAEASISDIIMALEGAPLASSVPSSSPAPAPRQEQEMPAPAAPAPAPEPPANAQPPVPAENPEPAPEEHLMDPVPDFSPANPFPAPAVQASEPASAQPAPAPAEEPKPQPTDPAPEPPVTAAKAPSPAIPQEEPSCSAPEPRPEPTSDTPEEPQRPASAISDAPVAPPDSPEPTFMDPEENLPPERRTSSFFDNLFDTASAPSRTPAPMVKEEPEAPAPQSGRTITEEDWKAALERAAANFPLQADFLANSVFSGHDGAFVAISFHPSDHQGMDSLGSGPLRAALEADLSQRGGVPVTISIRQDSSVPEPVQEELAPLPAPPPPAASAPSPKPQAPREKPAAAVQEPAREKDEDNSYYTDPLIDAAMEIFRARIISQ